MKKLYSIVLMAAALLIGTNAWAKDFNGNTAAELQDSIYTIVYGTESDHVIKLTKPVTLERAIWVGTKNLTDAYKSVTIDLNGFDITMVGEKDSKGNKVRYDMFVLSHGELKVINSNKTKDAKVQFDGVTADNSRIFAVYGSYRSSRWNEDGDALSADSINTRAQGWCSHLEIGDHVLLYATSQCLVEGIAIATDLGTSYYKDATQKETLGYTTKIFTSSSHGYAQGVKVDFLGKMDFTGASDAGKVYGISTKGTVRSALSANPDAPAAKNPEKIQDKFKQGGASYIKYLDKYYNYNDSIHKAPNKTLTHKKDTTDAPYVFVGDDAEVKVRNTGSKVAGVYAAGYAKWLIKGYVAGKTGLYASSGSVDLEDAHVASTAPTWTSTSNSGSANGGGSGVVINSRDAYSGDVDFVVEGDTKIESVKGYAIEEAVNSEVTVDNPLADPNNPNYDPTAPAVIPASGVSSVTIEGGTIIGGEKGAIVIADATKSETYQEQNPTSVVVYGGNVTGTTEFGTDGGDLDDMTASGTHTTEVVVDGKTIIVVSEGSDPEVKNSVAAATDYTAIKWQNPGNPTETLNADKVLTELEINETYAQTLTIAAGHKLTVGHVILGENAKIIVKPGAKLVVTGKDGISASKASCIKLETSESAQAILLFSTAVETNRQPLASVDMRVAAGMDGGENVWTRFAMPVKVQSEMWTKEHGYPTWVYEWDYEANEGEGDWALVPGGPTGMKPWTGYTLSYDETDYEVYTFTGNLVGNIDAALNFVHRGYNFFGNSYSGYIDAKTLLQGLADAHIDGAIYMWDAANQAYGAVTLNRLTTGKNVKDWEKDIASMQTFILQLRGASTAAETVNYASAIYANPRHGNTGNANQAPRRILASRSEDTNFEVIVTANNGKNDRIFFTEGADFTDAFESGYDASKFMNEGRLNVYATIDGENYSDVATNVLEGKSLSLTTNSEIAYTITFENVEGAEYAMWDKVANQVIAIEEGASYEFAAQPNSVVEGRFEIVNIHRMPTAIDNTEVKSNVKGIYTITGQFVGEDFNALPAGVYVVDGVKIVK